MRGRWVATINPAVLPRIRINRAYADIAGSRASGGAEMSRQLQEARWLIRNMEQRFVTIQRVADAIVAKQRNFFEYGEVAMKPLASEAHRHRARPARIDRQPGDQRQVHVDAARRCSSSSASSRASSRPTTAGRARRPRSARCCRRLIANEKPHDPLSDAQLARLLAAQGLRVARRTVTKYRTLMRLPSVELRRAMAHTAAAA